MAISLCFGGNAFAFDTETDDPASWIAYEDIRHPWIDYSSQNGYEWFLSSSGPYPNVKLAALARDNTTVYGLGHKTNRQRWANKMQKWAFSQYLVSNPSESWRTPVNFVISNGYPGNTAIGDVQIEVQWDYGAWSTAWSMDSHTSIETLHNYQLLDGILFSFEPVKKIKVSWVTYSYSTYNSCTLNLDENAFAHGVSITLASDCAMEYKRSFGAEWELRAGWNEEVCLNVLGSNPTTNGNGLNTYHCNWVTEPGTTAKT